MLTTMQVASVSCWPRRRDHKRHQFRGLRAAGRTSPVGRVCTIRDRSSGTIGGLSGRRRSTATPPFRSTDEPFRPSAASWSSVVPASKRPSGTSAGRRVRITPALCTSPQLGAYQPFRPRRAANSSTALLNTRQVAATHPAKLRRTNGCRFPRPYDEASSAVFTGVQFDADSSVLGDLA